LMRSSILRALAKNMLVSTRKQTSLVLTRTGRRSTLRKCSVLVTRPTVAICGRLARNKNKAKETATPVTKLNRPGFAEAGWFKLSLCQGLLCKLTVIVCLSFCRRNMTDGSE